MEELSVVRDAAEKKVVMCGRGAVVFGEVCLGRVVVRAAPVTYRYALN